MIRKRFLLNASFLSLCLAGTFASANAQGVDLAWVNTIAGSGADTGRSVFVDGQGNVFTTGSFQDTVDFDPGAAVLNQISVGGSDIFISKVDAAGNLVWAKGMGGTDLDEGKAIVVDASGNVYTAGYFTGTANFDLPGTQGARTSNGDKDIFITKHDASGNFLWVKTMGGTGLDQAMSLVLNNMDGIYITGQFEGSVDFGSGGSSNLTVTTNAPAAVFICKMDSSGTVNWVKSFNGNSSSMGNAIALDNTGNVYTTGSFVDTIDFNPGTASFPLIANGTQGMEDIFISKLDSLGNFIWAKQIGGSESDIAYSLKLDPWNNIILAGKFAGTVDFDPNAGVHNMASKFNTTLNLGIFSDGFVVKLDVDGNFIWAKQLGGEQFDEIKSIQTDSKGNIYATGFYQGIGTFGTNTLTAANGVWVPDIFISKMDTSGTFVWAKSIGGMGPDCGWAVTCASGNVYTTGMFYDDVDFDPGTGVHIVNGVGESDIFIQKMFCIDTTSSTLDIETCNNYMFGDEMLDTSGTYVHVIPNNSGCDSMITLQLIIHTIDSAIIQRNGADLTTTQTYTTYQWLKDGVVLNGANAAQYTVLENGDYQVVVTNANGCTDTSAIFNVNDVTGIINPELASQIFLYPNPTKDQINIKSPFTVDITIYSIDGRQLQQVKNSKKLSLKNLNAGVYFLYINDSDGHLLKVEKIFKQ